MEWAHWIHCCAKTVNSACAPLELTKYYHLSLYIIFIIQSIHSRVKYIILKSLISQYWLSHHQSKYYLSAKQNSSNWNNLWTSTLIWTQLHVPAHKNNNYFCLCVHENDVETPYNQFGGGNGLTLTMTYRFFHY